ncbi:Uncharacterised protein [Mycobacteroides abscessus subsp. abscessus]|nr:Uncharacterised protein [Mycobacteroides abscessus subsp. abscessus]
MYWILSPGCECTCACARLVAFRNAAFCSGVPSVATARNVKVVRARLMGCRSARPLSTLLSTTPYPTPGRASCMMMLAGPPSKARPMKLSATVGRRRQDHHGDSCAAGGTGSLRRLCVPGPPSPVSCASASGTCSIVTFDP